MLYKYDWSTVTEWSATALIILCVVFNSLNWYPVNVLTGFLGSTGWVITGFIWRKVSVIILNALLAAIYIGGVFLYFFQ